jgi:stearoyl-CoA desaturase (Delta-9 desaturase)
VATAFVVVPFAGLGVTVDCYRLLTHHSFTAVPALRVALAAAGSMSFDHLA